MASPDSLHLGVALEGAGWHPAAWREPDARPRDLFEGAYWAELVREAESGLLDFVTFEDSLGMQSDRRFEPDDRVDRVRGRLDAVLIASRVAPLTRHIGLLPAVVVTHTEPFHLSKAIATLDYVSQGRAGVRFQVSARADEARHFGRREAPPLSDLFEEAEQYIEVVRRLWDSWEDDAEIRDAATGRFIDRQKLHYIDFAGKWFSVRGPSITPRPPQGQPLVAALGHTTRPYWLIARSTDLGFVTPGNPAEAREIVEEIRRAERAVGRPGQPVIVIADVVVCLDDDPTVARARKDRLDELVGEAYDTDAHVFVGSPVQLADLLEEWAAWGIAGFRLRPAALPRDLEQITGHLVPELQRREIFRTAYEGSTWRDRFGLPRPANRYGTVP